MVRRSLNAAKKAVVFSLAALALFSLWAFVLGSEPVRQEVGQRLRHSASRRGMTLELGTLPEVGLLGSLALRDVQLSHVSGLSMTAERITVEPSLWALLGGGLAVSVDAEALSLTGGPLRAYRVERLLVAAAVNDSEAHDDDGSRAIDLGFVLPYDDRGSLTGRASSRGNQLHIHATGHNLPLRDLPNEVLAHLPAADASLDVRLDGELDPAAQGGRLVFSVHTDDGRIDDPRFAEEVIEPLILGVRGELAWTRDTFNVDDLRLDVGLAAQEVLHAQGTIGRGLDPALSLTVGLGPVAIDEVIEQLPFGLQPIAAAERPAPQPPLRGEISGKLRLLGTLHDPAQWLIDGGLDLSELRRESRGALVGLRQPFLHRVGEGVGRELVVGPSNPDFVPIDALPEHVVRAVTTAEDGGFFAHPGFDFDELKNSAIEGQTGRQRGGSTITQQLAKNLYLSRDKTLQRKAREALLAVALEGALHKQRILEIYLNVIEWGPDVYGIGAAARFHFGKAPTDLSAKEAAYLASIIPNPTRLGVRDGHGEVSETWAARIDQLLAQMAAHGTLDAVALERARGATLVFANN